MLNWKLGCTSCVDLLEIWCNLYALYMYGNVMKNDFDIKVLYWREIWLCVCLLKSSNDSSVKLYLN